MRETTGASAGRGWSRQARLGWTLARVTFVLYFGFLGLAILAPDLLASPIRAGGSIIRRSGEGEGRELAISRIAVVCIGVLAIALGLAFEQQNTAYLVGLAFGVAAAANFPILMLAMYWSSLTTRGAIVGGAVGLGSSIILTVVGPAVWVRTLGFAAPIFPFDPPTIVTLPLAFVTCWLVSTTDRSQQGVLDRAAFSVHFLGGKNATPVE